MWPSPAIVAEPMAVPWRSLAIMLTAAVAVETIFAWPGLGLLAYEAILGRDFPLMRGIILTVAVIVVIINLVVDIIYAYLDPRIRYS